MKIVVPYEHDSADLATVWLAVTRDARPGSDDWQPALRDTVDGHRVVWVRVPDRDASGAVWLRDRDGERRARRLT
ncbi:hypothetical protein [Microtetraspora malaysiensis]|uniref:GNAT family N-acetyltransferase n=1 Tax=Microtetraspora malaysiensis TaxID=161358 RepID=A0ABW6T316_9ACTN